LYALSAHVGVNTGERMGILQKILKITPKPTYEQLEKMLEIQHNEIKISNDRIKTLKSKLAIALSQKSVIRQRAYVQDHLWNFKDSVEGAFKLNQLKPDAKLGVIKKSLQNYYSAVTDEKASWPQNNELFTEQREVQ